MDTTLVNEVAESTESAIALPNGKYNISTSFTTRTVPWMKIGQILEEAPTAKRAAQLGGLDFDVELIPLTYEFNGVKRGAEKRKAVVRKDTGEMLGVVSAKVYKPIQYGEAFDFMDAVDSRYVAAGALKGGRQGFIVVKAPFTLNVLGNEDPHDLYGVLRTSHDCTRATEIMVMPLRGRCMNQLTLQSFSKNVPYRWSIKHVGDVKSKLAEAKDSLAKLANYGQRFEELVERLAEVKVTEGQARDILVKILPGKVKQEETAQTVLDLWGTSEFVGFRDNGWGLVNAVSDYMDWGRKGGTPESRFLNAIEGATHKTINKTAAALLRMA